MIMYMYVCEVWTMETTSTSYTDKIIGNGNSTFMHNRYHRLLIR